MTVSSHAIANEFIKLAQAQDKPLTNMQLQKLVFIANGYTLALFDRPLYYHNSHAWQWGPVIPKLYKSLQKYGSGFIKEFLASEDTVEDEEDLDVIKGVWDAYGHYTGIQLSTLTHQKNTPWSITWEKERFSVIPNELIAQHYKGLVEST